MLILLAPVLLLVTALALLVLRLVRPRFRFSWLASFVAAGVALVTVLLWRFQLPLTTAISGWGSTIGFPTAPTFSASTPSWAYALAVSGLLVAVVLVAPTWPDFQNSTGLASALAFSGLALLAVAADNLFTIVLVWAAMDLAEVGLALRWAGEGDAGSRAISTFSVRLGSLALVLLVHVLTGGAPKSGGYSLLIVAAVALRMVVLPTRLPAGASAYMQSSTGVGLQLASAAASLALLSRIQVVDLAAPGLQTILVVFAGLALYSGWMWLRSADDSSLRRFWILALSCFAMGSTLLGNPIGGTAWGICLVLLGGTLLMSPAQHTWLNRAAFIGTWSLSALPFSVSGGGWNIAAGAATWILPLFLLAQALLLAGFIYQAARPTKPLSLAGQAGWVRGSFATGIGLMILIIVALGVWGWEGAMQTQSWLAGLIATALGLAIYWGRSRIGVIDRIPRDSLQQGTARTKSLFRRGVLYLSEAIRQLVAGVTRLFEGQAGIMWGLLFLVLIVSLIVGRSP